MNLHCYYSYTCLAVPSFLALLLVSISKENGQHVNAFTASLRTTIPFSYWNKVTTGTTATNNYGTQLHSTSSSNRQPRQKQQQPRRNEKGRGKRTPPSNNRASSSSPPQRKQTTIEKANQEYKEKRLTKRMIRQFQLLEKTMDEMKDSDKEGSTDGDEDGDDDVGAKSSSNNLQRQCDQLLGICAAANEWTKYQQVLDIMNDNPVVSYQHSSFYTSLRECYSNGNGLASIQIFEAIEKENKDIQITTQDIDLIIGALCKTNYNNGLWEKAVEIIHYAADNYDQINGNTDTTNTSKGSTAASTSTRTSTVSGGIRIESYNNVLIKMEHDKEWEEAMKLLSLMEKEDEQQQEGGRRHPSPNLATYHAVLSVLIADHQLDKATNLLLSLSSPTSKVQPSMYTFEMVMSALTAPTSSRNRNYKNNSNNEHYKQAIELLNTMNELKYIQNVPIELHNRVISSCIKARQTQSALSIFQNMRNSNSNAQQPDIVTYNSLISGCASAGLTKEAFQLFNEIRNRKVRSGGTGQKKEQDGTNQNQNDDDSNLVKPDVITYTNTVRACGRAKNAKKALLLLDDAKKQLIPLDVFIYTAVIDVCGKGRQWRTALDLMNDMKKNSIIPNQHTYSALINALGNSGQWERALDVLDQMREKNMKINVFAYNSAIAALAKASRSRSIGSNSSRSNMSSSGSNSKSNEGGESDYDKTKLWIRAMELLNQMKKDRVWPDKYSYSSAISCCAAGSRYEEALDLIKVMRDGPGKLRPNRISYTGAMTACARAGEWPHALRLFADMKSDRIKFDVVAYNALISAFMNGGKPDMAFEVWNAMCGKQQSTNLTGIDSNIDNDVRPDIITLTNVVACLERAEGIDNLNRMDQVFEDAVEREIVFSNDSMDTAWEIDLSGMSLPVARAACRYIIKRLLRTNPGDDVEDLMLITGVGKQYHHQHQDEGDEQGNEGTRPSRTALREYVRQILREDFEPPLYSTIPSNAAGIVQVNKHVVEQWMETQKHSSQ